MCIFCSSTEILTLENFYAPSLSRLALLRHRPPLHSLLHQGAQEAGVQQREERLRGHIRPETRGRHVRPAVQEGAGELETPHRRHPPDDAGAQRRRPGRVPPAVLLHPEGVPVDARGVQLLFFGEHRGALDRWVSQSRKGLVPSTLFLITSFVPKP